jgi:hypothetical protein
MSAITRRTSVRRVMGRGFLGRLALVAAPVALCLTASIGLGSGCQSVEKVEISNIFRQVPERPLADVPVPVGFRYKQKGSYIFNNNFRVARLCYSGTPWPEDALAFFAQQMPLSKWRPTGSETVDGWDILRFENEVESCAVKLDRKKGITSIVIDIAPRETS